MIRIRQIFIGIHEDFDKVLKVKVAKKLGISINKIEEISINKKALDARKKKNIHYVVEADVKVQNEENILKRNTSKDIFKTPKEEYKFVVSGTKKLSSRPIVVGAGPAGLFAAYLLTEAGYKPLVIERGEKVEERVKKVEDFWTKGKLDLNSNVQFGEGGAGTFSDGKLNTLVKDKHFRMKKVFEIFVKCGAPEEILIVNNPHIGTDILRTVVINMRKEIIKMGGEIRYNTSFTDLIIKDNALEAIIVNNKELIKCTNLVLAIGHSARDTFKLLLKKGIHMTNKPFAVGLRIIHKQDMISKNQYGIDYRCLEPASYKLTHNTKNGRGVYSFCMCPGGYVVNASSEENRLVINGMSNYKRDSGYANSAIVVTVNENDFGISPLSGMYFQRKLEEKAYLLGKGSIPVQLYKDFKCGKNSVPIKSIAGAVKGNYRPADLNELFPKPISEALKEGIDSFDKKIPGFAGDEALVLGVESRTSSPVRIIRDETFMANIKGIYPCGEGAGYAGGITTSAMDGIKVAEAIASKYEKFQN